MIDLMQIGLGFILSIVIGGVAFARRSLSESGWLGAVLVGTLTFGFGGWPWGLTLIVFFVTSSILSHYKESIKERRAAEKFSKGGRRDFFQTIANGGLGALCAVAYALSDQPWWLLAAFVGLMATVNADTWATELGVLSPHPPRLITTRQPVPPGTSGGVTLLGTSAAAAGGLLIGVAMFVFSALSAPETPLPWWMLLAGLLGGLGGALFDSLLGATVQAIYVYPDGRETERRVARDGTPNRFLRGWRWMDNDLVNLISSVGGAIIAIVIALIAGGAQS
ncbi:DUF92 domain-containing protein [Chloroflexus sp.]|uniref:DUF92 domain-containing protein n=1 Tax=Chloroflexus sp. TaxID=1904827 RepID=UPI00298EECF9|nr:DUF92 domain-containing protein [Chloroflexus sp.]MCS6887792.1 DUF92 domain-containing protein [Chloroflexus sp.]MDW8405013.1 DUF92 domain-containing protein [Chloroflexus sp.]